MSAKTTQPNKNKILRIMKIPFRALGKIRNFYVKSMMNYAGKMSYADHRSSSNIPGLPKSYSANYAARSYHNEDFRELVRAASARTMGTRFDLGSPQTPERAAVSGGGTQAEAAVAARSKSVAMGRIDEDSPVCYFGGDSINVVSLKNELKYPRSRSQAVTRRRTDTFN